MLCPNISSFQTRVPHKQHLQPFFFCSPQLGSSSTPPPLPSTPNPGRHLWLCRAVALQSCPFLDIFSGSSCPLLATRPCQHLDPRNSPGFLLSLPPPTSLCPHICLCSVSGSPAGTKTHHSALLLSVGQSMKI